MSQTLYWKPTQEYSDYVDDDLKFKLRKYFEVSPIHGQYLNGGDLAFLKGLLIGGVKEAEELIDAINHHGEIELNEQ